MIDVAAAVALLIGSLLIALGGIGLLRFPDVFTRMHAATKAASVGVIGTIAAAALEAGGLSSVLVLVLAMALLFLSGPLGMSLLARAAYHDPETPRAPTTQQLALPAPESTAVQRAGGTSPLLAGWLFVVWVAAFGAFRANVVVSGLVIAATVAVALRHLAPRWPGAFLHPVGAARFILDFAAQLVLSTWDVIRTLRVPVRELRPAVVELPLRVRTRNEVTLLMNTISFTPGTVALELHDDHLYVHVLTSFGIETVLAGMDRMQDRIIAAFGERRAT